jgi:hypothetical protein
MPHAAACQSLERRVSALLQFLAVLRAGAAPAKIITMSVETITNGGESPCTVADYWCTDRENKETGRIRQAQGKCCNTEWRSGTGKTNSNRLSHKGRRHRKALAGALTIAKSR